MISNPMSILDSVLIMLILGAAWTFFFTIRCLFWVQVPSKPKGVRYWHLMRARFYQATRQRERLCGYHLASYLRPGQSAQLDSENCEKCHQEVL